MPKSLPQKFFIKENYILLVINALQTFIAEQLSPLPDGVVISTDVMDAPFDIQIYFIKSKEEVDQILPDAIKALKPKTFLWLCYPKGGARAKIATDLNRDSFWEIAASNKLKPVHQISIDETWSGLRFRLED